MKQYVVDAFADKVFAGNQAAVCVPDAWPAESLMMSIAAENNFSGTAFVVRPLAAYMGCDLLCVLPSAAAVYKAVPDQGKVRELDGLLLHITAPGGGDEPYDCVSRSFAPKLAVAEDPACGSGHCHIVPYWAQELGKDNLLAYQASRRGGVLQCRLQGDRVTLAGHAALFSAADLYV